MKEVKCAMNNETNERYPTVNASFCLFIREQDIDLSYLDEHLGMKGKLRRKSEFRPDLEEYSSSYWYVELKRDGVVSAEDVLQELLEPLYERTETVKTIMDEAGLSASVTLFICYDEENYLPLLWFGPKTLAMMNALHVTEFSLDC